MFFLVNFRNFKFCCFFRILFFSISLVANYLFPIYNLIKCLTKKYSLITYFILYHKLQVLLKLRNELSEWRDGIPLKKDLMNDKCFYFYLTKCRKARKLRYLKSLTNEILAFILRNGMLWIAKKSDRQTKKLDYKPKKIL
jgi:hypothetical protein